MSLKIFNTKTRQKETFTPIEPGKVKMYVCGVTTYDDCHIGHARSAVVFDMIVRQLRKSYDVLFVRNITDIEDKIINRAKEREVPWHEISRIYTEEMNRDFGALDILSPDVEPKASEHIAEMQSMIQQLIDKNLAYEEEGDVFFAVRNFKTYGEFSKKDIEDLMSGARIGIDERKRDPLDFALWKAAKPDEPSWESPWGRGRPGWHIECSAMATKYLGNTFDIHGGGRDLIFPHHENEIAQSEGACGETFANVWIHNGFVTINKEKMSKSLNNFFAIKEVLSRYHKEVVRLFLLTSHYRGPIDYTDENFDDARARVDRIYQFKARAKRMTGHVKVPNELQALVDQMGPRVNEAMNDDFNTPMALGSIFEVIRQCNIFFDESQDGNQELALHTVKQIEQASEVMGLFQLEPEEWLHRIVGQDRDVSDKDIQNLMDERAQARQDKNWKRADEIRDQLIEMKIILEDTPQGTVWRRG